MFAWRHAAQFLRDDPALQDRATLHHQQDAMQGAMMVRTMIKAASLGAAALFAVAVAGDVQAQAKNRADCEKLFKPTVGQSGKDVVWVPTPDELVRRMLTMAKVTDKDFVIDLGAGDGKIAIAAAKAPFNANSMGIEYNPDMVKLANCMVQVEGVPSKTKVIQGDIFKEDFTKADVITMYLLPELNLCVRHRILGMKPGTRVTSHQFTMGDWKADETAEIEYRTAYLWIVPARVAGAWTFKDAIIVGIVIGAGIFKAPSWSRMTGSAGWMFAPGCWAGCVADRRAVLRRARDGLSARRRRLPLPAPRLRPAVSFLFAWARFSVITTGSIALLASCSATT
jgi:phospholipid N-methyltransferase